MGKPFAEAQTPILQALLDDLLRRQAEISIEHSFYEYLEQHLTAMPTGISRFGRTDSLAGTRFVLSIGGDGTLLDTITYVGALQIPILGINTGRLGFLATINAMVSAGLGVAALPELAAAVASDAGLVKRRLTEPDMPRPIGLVTRRGRSLSPASAAMVAFLREEMMRWVPEWPSK